MTLDPVDYAVISQAVLAAAREMGTKLVRSAYSNIVREARDASAAILDCDGNVVAQAEMVPMQLGSMNTTLRACLEVASEAFDVNPVDVEESVVVWPAPCGADADLTCTRHGCRRGSQPRTRATSSARRRS